MKKILLTMLVFFTFNLVSYSQEQLTFSEVITADSLDKISLYTSLRGWVATSYNSAQDVIQMDDKDSGIIICSALFDYSYGKLAYTAYDGVVKYTLKIQIKDNRFKVELSNFIHQNCISCSKKCNLGAIYTSETYTNKGMQKKFDNNVWNDIQQKSKAYSMLIFEKLRYVALNSTTINNNSDNW